MKKHCVLPAFVLMAILFVGCVPQKAAPAGNHYDPIGAAMKMPYLQPQLTTEEFLKITDEYLATGAWHQPYEKACFSASGIDYNCYIIDSRYLFSILTEYRYGELLEYTATLQHYTNGKPDRSVNDPRQFRDFFSNNNRLDPKGQACFL